MSAMDSKKPPESAEESALRRRSSSRSIKRKKFDDELVDSLSTSYPKSKPPKLCEGIEKGHSSSSEVSQFEDVQKVESPAPVENPKKPTKSTVQREQHTCNSSNSSSSSKKKNRKEFQTTNKFVKENNYWKPSDDLSLIINVDQTNDLTKVFKGVKFSSKFTYAEIESRWRSLLYDVNVKNLALASIRQLHVDIVHSIESKALFSDAEEALLKKLDSRSQPSLEVLQALINDNPQVFRASRNPKGLLKHWNFLRYYHLLDDQLSSSNVQTLSRHESVVSFDEIEAIVRKEIEEEMKNPSSAPPPQACDLIEQEITRSMRKNMTEIRMLENELPKYQSLMDSITGIVPSDFEGETFAVLRGRLVRYLMRSHEITIGRSTKDFMVDVDLSLEGPSNKISRLQAVINLQDTGEFIVYNTGKHPIYINSTPLVQNASLQINNNSLIEFSSLKFIFLINQDLISMRRNEILQACK